jgi:hypothetical protein
MPVIINEFEIITEPAPPSGGETAAAQAPPPAPLHPEEVVRIVRRQQARLARVRAD